MDNNHFDGITPEQRWRNDILNEQRKTNELLAKLIGCNAQVTDTKAQPKPKGRAANGHANRMAKG